ncbi:phosphotriesterase-related protein [Rhodococcus ruber]|jgi:phosphotriesterase-related protein|uniref:phosphotriesterase family protein n=1 Tax=Rhodococcus TaxID=1827 RepID=UPI00029A3699|nr:MULTISPECIES: phosphotriesterase [Rhodococcus]ATQ31293.1 phosphotriesterase-related protein [Rhodococcus ruber]AUM16077.1 phosphotriesterase-related protein [Rhodococcus ruber]AWG98234.1 phosphotriesterase-related protein [Rhodococcus ruber]AXY51121.1 phosphotriesterase [Rhodococcus ruber]MBD8052661.1 phosphotriesterase-related protein [Rhodococcus ruber]
MTTVPTVTGTVDSGSLGRTLMHEHLFVLSPELHGNWDIGVDLDAAVAEAITRVREVHAAGFDTFVDLTVVGTGRNIDLIRRVAEATDMNIVVATGLYTYMDLPHYFHYRGPDTLFGGPEPMVDFFVRDIEEGILDSGVRAGMLKCAIDAPGLTAGVERTARAVAVAHRRTGVPITVHTHAHSESGRVMQRLFTEEGVDLSRVIVGHSGDSDDIGYLTALMDAGSYIGMDRCGVDVYLGFEQRVKTIAALVERGYAGRMLLSQDYATLNDWLDPQMLAVATPRWSYMHLHNDVLPALREAGVGDTDIDRMLIDNPREIFERRDTY